MEDTKILIFIVAYNAEAKIESVLSRIPKKILFTTNYEILIIDDNSKDSTFLAANRFKFSNIDLNLTILYNPINQGYGGNQKLGYHYAIKNNFDFVILLHGDGQYAPELIPEMLSPFSDTNVKAVFGSRMINKSDALKGGMPFYKFIGNQVLTRTQNLLLGSSLSEFHSGYRAYSVLWLKSVPFEYNSNDFDFDTQIIIQLIGTQSKIVEIPIPTFYGDEICHVNGFKYAYNIIKDTIQYKLQKLGIFYKREYDLPKREPHYPLKLGYSSSHTLAYQLINDNSKVLDIGCGIGLFASTLKRKNCTVTGIDIINLQETSMFEKYHELDIDKLNEDFDYTGYDYILLLDVIDQLSSPEKFFSNLRKQIDNPELKIIITTPNIAFFIMRLSLLFGNFNYSKKGILDLNHKRLFTTKTIKHLLTQTGFIIEKEKGIPAPIPQAIGINPFSKLALLINQLGIFLWKSLFSYQTLVVVKAKPTIENILSLTIKETEAKSKELLDA